MLWISFVHFMLSYFGGAPPGTVQVSKNFYVERSEVLNVHYNEFLDNQKQILSPSEFEKLKPAKWNTWHRELGQRYYPIVGITKDQAIAYAKWLSGLYSNHLKRKIEYRLPTQDEWNQVAEFYTKFLSEKQLYKMYKRITFESKAYKDKYFGSMVEFENATREDVIIHLFDNVSEMVAEPGLAKGGNNEHLILFSESTDWYLQYDSPHQMVGFRLVASYPEKVISKSK